MASLSLNDRAHPHLLFDRVRKKWVEKTPEEVIRQLLLHHMIDKLGFPPAYLAVEKELSSLPHLQLTALRALPKRRIDLLVFAKRGEEVKPLLLIECKAVALTPLFAQQVVGYNAFVQAPFVALANEEQVLTGHFDSQAGQFIFSKGLPSYQTLLHQLN